jgi:hypothetical protein
MHSDYTVRSPKYHVSCQAARFVRFRQSFVQAGPWRHHQRNHHPYSKHDCCSHDTLPWPGMRACACKIGRRLGRCKCTVPVFTAAATVKVRISRPGAPSSQARVAIASGHCPSSCLSFETRLFGDWTLSAPSGGPNKQS